MRISLFITCFNDTLFPQSGQATVQLLERLGHTVEFRSEQTCCGQMHFNTGYQREALPLVRRFVQVFGDAEVVVAPSASCVGMVRDMYNMAADLADDPSLTQAIHELQPRVFELTEFLVTRLGMDDVGAYFQAGSSAASAISVRRWSIFLSTSSGEAASVTMTVLKL